MCFLGRLRQIQPFASKLDMSALTLKGKICRRRNYHPVLYEILLVKKYFNPFLYVEK
jgi:hypothetical protein